ncbi:rhamnose-binding lectin-like [Labrus mixtus]|uniref:rhamnose-binding lectin-like n=1 Tax=Labrus mixtus TaxID=508554 RepID=UPI0029C03E62|nr:rhamnose-binding lectin-like [Labrus mixtus]
MLHFSITVWLAAFCLLVHEGVTSYRVTTCEGNNVHRLSCDSGVISVQMSVYGRKDTQTCSEGKPSGQTSNTDCSMSEAQGVLKGWCDGKTVCEFSSADFSVPDPCPDTFKYLQTNYDCLPAIYHVTCEHSFAHLQCDAGQVIFVQAAKYGRTDPTKCFYKRPVSQTSNVYCSIPASKVAESCNGESSCVIQASNSVFGDPCQGTYKYLEVAYTCEYPVSSPDESKQNMLRFKLSNTLLLAAICMLMTSVASIDTVVTCDNSQNVHRLNCDNGVIIVQAALYGRANTMTCSMDRPEEQLADTECALDGTVDILKRRCDGKQMCELSPNVVRTSDPCIGIYKYLETNFTCMPAFHLTACEHSYAYLHCDVGQVIFVFGADYGRHDRTTCSFMRPTSQLQDVVCSQPTQKVADSCNGKNSCMVRASNSMFGDPCVNTYKYLEVAYVCEYPLSMPYENMV